MKNPDNICMNCFSDLTEGVVCAECGFDNDTQSNTEYLPLKTILNDRYIIGTAVSRESDAVTYMAYDNQLDSVVTVREFLPKGIAGRLEGNIEVHVRERFKSKFETYKQSFLDLWATILKMRNLSAVIPSYDVFECNATAYAVSEYFETISLREFLLRNPDGNITWDRARLMFMPVLTTLEALHNNGIIHGGITPENMVLCRDGKMRLKGFCISEANTINSDLEFNVTDGYTAIEQYDNQHKMCPATDIYAFSACIYRALVGTNPPDAQSRETNDKLMIPNRIAEAIPTHVIKALGSGLQIYPEKRTQSVYNFRELLNAAPPVVAAAAETQEPAPKPARQEKDSFNGYPDYDEYKGRNSRNKIIIAVLVVLIIAAVGIGIYLVGYSDLIGGGTEESTGDVSVSTYEVPDFISAGYTQSDVENHGVWNQQFTIQFTSEYSTDAEEGIIFKQSLESGEIVDEGTTIVLTVSKGIQTEEVPDCGGLTVEAATEKLEALGFEVTTVEIYNDGGHTANTVRNNYGMAPAAGTVCAVGEEIILQVYGEVAATQESDTQAQ